MFRPADDHLGDDSYEHHARRWLIPLMLLAGIAVLAMITYMAARYYRM